MPQPAQPVRDTYAAYPAPARKRLLAIRALILEIAAANPTIGPIEETLKWGEPAYLPSRTRSGTTIRLAWKRATPDACGIYFNCQTTLVDSFRTLFPELTCEGNRAILLDCSQALPEASIARCIEMALLYHHDKRRSAVPRQPA